MEAMLKHAQDVLRMEAEAILELVPRVDENFAAAVKLILDCQGRTVITGMGKSGLIGRKMAATLPAPAHHPFICILQRVFTVTWAWLRKAMLLLLSPTAVKPVRF